MSDEIQIIMPPDGTAAIASCDPPASHPHWRERLFTIAAYRHVSVFTLLALFSISFSGLFFGCAAGPRSPYVPQTESRRNTAEAERLTRLAADENNPDRAEALLRDALAADLYHGPAHNNLGVLYLRQSKFYEAAGEFEWARKLMPGHPDPRLNLALTLERVGRTTDALAAYEAALEVAPEHLPTMQALARLLLRTNTPDPRTPTLLDEIAMRSDSEEWRTWARTHRLALDSRVRK